MSKTYKISTLTLQGRQLTFHVKEYSISAGDFVEFTDEKTGIHKKFHASRCEITGIDEGDRF